MWLQKYNSNTSLFYEYQNPNSNWRQAYDVYLDDELIHYQLETNTFSIFNLLNGEYQLKVVADEIELQTTVKIADQNYFLDVCTYLHHLPIEADVTANIQALINSAPKDTSLYFKARKYNITSLFLKSNIRLIFATGAEFNVLTERQAFTIIPGLVENKNFTKEKCLASWEGNPASSFSGVINGFNVENVELIGQLTINGNASYDNWWDDAKVKKIAWRPKLIFLNNCSNIIIHGLQLVNSPSWNVHPFYSEKLKFYAMTIHSEKDSPNTDGINPESCFVVEINACKFDLGDDCITIKSGKLYMAKSHYQQTSKIKISNCQMKNGHGAIVLGSEIACGLRDLEIINCDFIGTDRGLRVKTRRGRGKLSVIDNIKFKNITMNNVLAPITINAYYNCDPDGNSDYVASEEKVAVDERTPFLGSFSFENLICHNIHHCICIAHGLAEMPIEKLEISNSKFHFATEQHAGYPLMQRDTTLIKGEIINAKNVKRLYFEHNQIENGQKEVCNIENVCEIKENNNEYFK